MSYRELRNFTETMKALGYPRLISVENFRTPNFELVADALYWLVHRYDPSAEVDENISTESHRVSFLKSVATVMMSKARVKLNLKALYRADGYAVKELLKISSLLYDAIQLDDGGGSGGGTDSTDGDVTAAGDVSLSARLDQLRDARTLSGEILESGSKLFGLLGREGAELRESRDRALGFLDSISLNLDAAGGSGDPHALIERNVAQQVALLGDQVVEVTRAKEDAEAQATKLRQKIERKTTELDRAQKRLRSLARVKPAYMDEFLSLENELRQVYEVYLERFRNLAYLEGELNRVHAVELERKAEGDRALKRMQRRLREEELRILRGDQPVDEAHIDDDQFDDDRDDDRGRGSDDSDDGGGRKRGKVGGGRRRGALGSDDDDSSDPDDDDDSGASGSSSDDDDDSDEDDDDDEEKSDDEDSSDEDSEDDDDMGGRGNRGGGGAGASRGKPPGGPGVGGARGGSRAPPPGGDDSEPPSSDEDDDDEAF